MKTLNRNLKVTEKELQELNNAFSEGKKLYRKVVLFGAGHPQLPSLFFTKMDEGAETEFWRDHETTHAKFKEYSSVEDLKQDKDFWRSDLTYPRQEFEAWQLPCYR